jgi:hypothetical protein
MQIMHVFVEYVKYVDYHHVSYYAYYTYYAYLIQICITEQGSPGHSASSSVQQQCWSYCPLLHPRDWVYWCHAHILLAICAEEIAADQ